MPAGRVEEPSCPTNGPLLTELTEFHGRGFRLGSLRSLPTFYHVTAGGLRMAQIIKFPRTPFRSVRVPTSKVHVVSVRVIDRDEPDEARWHLQYAIQRAGTFAALDGFTNQCARRRRWHSFDVKKRYLIRRFVREIGRLVLEKRVVVEIDDVRVRPLRRAS